MAKYIAVDCGKYDTKVAIYNSVSKSYKKFKFRTKESEGTFIDDMLERGTFITSVDGGPVVKIGNGARKEAELETTKKSEIHRTCTLTAIAMAVEEDGEDVNVVIGIPYQTCCIPEERIDYKNYILPEGKHSVQLKLDSNSAAKMVTFNLVKRFVYPESIGVLYEYPRELSDIAGIVDIGNLNNNCTYCDEFNIIHESSFTDELGGKIIINNLAQELSAELNARCDDKLVAKILRRPLQARCLVSSKGDKTVEDKSREIIDRFLMEHVQQIKRKCDAKHWPSCDFMKMCFIGGTTRLLVPEIKEVFGNNVLIPEEPEYVNVEGFLKRFCAADNIDISDAITPKAKKGAA